MKAGWIIRSLGDVGKVSMCKRVLKKQTNTVGGIPFYKIGTFGKEPNAYIDEELYNEFREKYSFPKKGDILLSASGTIGRRVVYDGKPAYFQDSNIVWIDNDESEVLNEYLYKFYGHCKWNASKGATISRLYNDDLRRIQIPIPPLEEQKQIVSILDEAFEAIDQAQENIERNIENAKELFQSKLNDIFSQKGEGWEERSLGDLSLLKSGGTPLTSNPSYWANEGIAWYSSGELNDTYTQEPERHITNLGLKNSNAKVFPEGSLLIGMYDTAALKMSIIDRDATFNQAIVGVEPNSDIDLNFIMLSIQSQKSDILKLRRGVRQKNLNQTKIKAIKIYLPEISIQKDLVSKINEVNLQLNKLVDYYQQKLTNLNDLKKSLLEKAFAGELSST